MDTIPLTATARTAETSATSLRHANQVPCVVYGNKTENMSIACVYNEIYKAYAQAGESAIIELDVAGAKVPVLFHQIQTDPVSDRLIHVDFYAVDMKKEVEANVQVVFEGEAPAVKDLGGVLLTTQDHVTVRCLPTNLPHELTVSVEKIVDFETAVHVSDITVPDGVEILDDPDVTLATAQEPRAAVEEEPTAGETTEGEEGEKKEEGGEEKPAAGGDDA